MSSAQILALHQELHTVLHFHKEQGCYDFPLCYCLALNCSFLLLFSYQFPQGPLRELAEYGLLSLRVCVVALKEKKITFKPTMSGKMILIISTDICM